MEVRTPDLDLDLVRCFLVVAESGGFTTAARRLNLSQSAVSLKVQRLETLLGRSLFARTSRTVQLTCEGEVMLSYARRLLALSQEMVRRVAHPAMEGTLRLGVVQQFGQQFLPDLLARFKRAHPRVSLCVEVGISADLLAAMEEDRFDLVLAAAGFTPGPAAAGIEGLREERVIFREPLIWTQAHDSALDPRTDPVPLILFAPPCGFRRAAFDALEAAGRPWQVVYASASLASIQAAVRADLGIALLGRSSVLPGMKVVPTKAGLPSLPDTAISLYLRKSAREPLAQSLGSFISTAVTRA